MLFRISRQREIIVNGNFNKSFPSEYLSMGVKERECSSRPEISEYCFNNQCFSCPAIFAITWMPSGHLLNMLAIWDSRTSKWYFKQTQSKFKPKPHVADHTNWAKTIGLLAQNQMSLIANIPKFIFENLFYTPHTCGLASEMLSDKSSYIYPMISMDIITSNSVLETCKTPKYKTHKYSL